MNAGENTPVSQPSVVIMQRVTPSESVIKLQSSFIELDPANDEYDIEHLEKYSRNTLERIIKWSISIGYKIAKKEGDHDKMKYYAEGIQKFERQLLLPVSTFPDMLKEETENDLDSAKQKQEGSLVNNEP